MPDVYLDEVTGDIWISDLGKTRLTQTLQEEVRQRLDAKYQMFLGEWFLDARQGVPWFRDIFVKSPDMPVVRSVLTRVASEDPGVDSVLRADFELDGRTLLVTLEVQLTDGSTVTLYDKEFIL